MIRTNDGGHPGRPPRLTEGTALDPYSDLRDFYRRLDEILPAPDLPPVEGLGAQPPATNPCGSCGDCCRWFFYLSRHEWDYLAHHMRESGRPLPAVFKVAVTPEQDERLQFEEWRCPLWADGVGCTAYEARPLACRLAGPYLPEHSKLPGHCIFTRPIRYSTVEGIPLWDDYVKVLRRHPSPPGYIAPATGAPATPGRSPGSPGGSS